MPKIAIVTDSTDYIPPDLVKKHNLTVTPQILIWGEESYLDGIDIQPNEFYARLESAKVMPTTSQVTPATMKSTSASPLTKATLYFNPIGPEPLERGTCSSAIVLKMANGQSLKIWEKE